MSIIGQQIERAGDIARLVKVKIDEDQDIAQQLAAAPGAGESSMGQLQMHSQPTVLECRVMRISCVESRNSRQRFKTFAPEFVRRLPFSFLGKARVLAGPACRCNSAGGRQLALSRFENRRHIGQALFAAGHSQEKDDERMKLGITLMICVFAWGAAHADEATQCRASGGTYLTGRVTDGPRFARGRHPLHGIELSHTHLTLQSDQDGQSYDVAVDNVFASGYDAAGESVPAPLSNLRVGDRLEVCGRPYRDDTRLGMDWVHTNCGATPSDRKPNGWLKSLGTGGMPGPNLEASEEYCRLW